MLNTLYTISTEIPRRYTSNSKTADARVTSSTISQHNIRLSTELRKLIHEMRLYLGNMRTFCIRKEKE